MITSILTTACRQLAALVILHALPGCDPPAPPAPAGAVPSARQLEWHALEYYAFIHFSPNTFTDMEWGYGDESPAIFDPSALDCMQWARVLSEAGMEGIVITAKHHDGFCLWPSAYTDHSVRNSPWRNGQGDLLAELREACDAYGLRLGIYLSPWDRNHAAYGTSGYIDYYRDQLRELLTGYGEIFEVWFDGANGGDGYYGGARETRKIDNRTYYDWETTRAIVRELQPMAVMFSDAGPDIRWVGNEQGYAGDPNWCTLNSSGFYPGVSGKLEQLGTGHEDGDDWIPAEVNTSIRPGWFYHESQDTLVKSLEELVDIWFHSVGMNGNLILNVPPDRRGLIHERDVERLMEFKKFRDEAFDEDLAVGAGITASNTRGGASEYGPENVLDSDPRTCWACDDGVVSASLVLEFAEETAFNTLLLREFITLGQRIRGFGIDADLGEGFVEVASGITIGNRRLVRFDDVRSKRLRIRFNGKACPVISTVGVFNVPGIQGR